ncbi:MAG: iron-containing alcohol dehydrogenase, partial [Chloroflexota bacterium]
MTEVPSGEFKPTRVSLIVFGRGSLEQLKTKVAELGARRALIVTVPPIVTETGFVERIKGLLGESCAGVFSGVVQHVPRQCVIAGARAAREAGADMLISLGGSSTADAAKGINLALAEAETPEAFFARFDRAEFTAPGSLRATEFTQPKLPFIAIPTTLSGGEFTAGAGITDTVRKHKDVLYDDRVTARVVILDPEMTVHTGRELWASTAMKSLADCFEVVCSARHQPFADALSLHAARLINQYLLPSVAEPMDMGARALLQHAAG